MVSERDKLKAAIEQRFGSVHAFCRATKINRTTVYTVLGGTYAGNESKQLGRIQEALDAGGGAGAPGLPGLAALEETIREATCKRCPADNAPICRRCAPQFALQAQAVRDLLERRAQGGDDG